VKAIALISGGLDSILAARVVQGQGIEILPLHFMIPFCHLDKKSQGKMPDKFSLVRDNLGVELKEIDISASFLDLIVNPRYGFGSNMNPCIDCKILMLAKAKELMQQWGASFVVTGEVLGQRPMSQHRQALELIEKRSGLGGLLLRPLSARLLSATVAEKEGSVHREKLMNISGRGRKPQIELAKNFDIKEYSNPAGGCLLTDPEFTKRLKELIARRELSVENVELLKFGRHFRLAENLKLIVGRSERENEELIKLSRENDYLFMPNEELAGPTCLGRGNLTQELIELSCRIACRYCDLNGAANAKIYYRKAGTVPCGDSPCFLISVPIEGNELLSLRI
jgi:tRNA-uridine 2-sulfurtransferase